jgi:hypothetical protein
MSFFKWLFLPLIFIINKGAQPVHKDQNGSRGRSRGEGAGAALVALEWAVVGAD